MPRKPSKRTIASATKQYESWRADIDRRSAAITAPNAQRAIAAMADDVAARIASGELGICTRAAIRSVARVVEDFESGFYASAHRNSSGDYGFQCRAAN